MVTRKGHSVEPFGANEQSNVTLNIELPNNRLTDFTNPHINKSTDQMISVVDQELPMPKLKLSVPAIEKSEKKESKRYLHQ